MHIIGAHPKSMDDFQRLNKEEISAFVKGMEQYIASETPMEIPIGISGNDLCRLTLTLRHLVEFVEKVAHAEAGIEAPGGDLLKDRWSELQTEAQSLMVVRPRLIIPK